MAEAPVLGGARARRSRSTTPPSARASTVRCCTSRCAPSSPRAAAAPPSTKTRGLVSGGNSKPWRQKGTGRARAGSTRSPIFTGGGVVFGPHPRSYTFKVNRKERRAALRSALSLHAQRGSIAILDAAAFAEPSTKAAAALLADWGRAARDARRRDRARSAAPALSFRNIERVSVLTPSRRRRRRHRRRGLAAVLGGRARAS